MHKISLLEDEWVPSSHYKFPKNPYYRCMFEWNNLTVDLSLIDDKYVFSRVIKALVQNPYEKVL